MARVCHVRSIMAGKGVNELLDTILFFLCDDNEMAKQELRNKCQMKDSQDLLHAKLGKLKSMQVQKKKILENAQKN